MTALNGILDRVFAMAEFSDGDHSDPLDRLVARLINLRSAAYEKPQTLFSSHYSSTRLHAGMFADAVLAMIQKEREYSFLHDVVGWIKASDPCLFDETLAMNQAPSVVENIDFYNSIIDFCEKQLGSLKDDEADNPYNAFGSISWGMPDAERIFEHEMPHGLPGYFDLPFRGFSGTSELGPSLFNVPKTDTDDSGH